MRAKMKLKAEERKRRRKNGSTKWEPKINGHMISN
jgi:hypothetical protein